MSQKAVSNLYGVSKGAALTIVRLPEPILTPEEIAAGVDTTGRFHTFIDACRQILTDVLAKGLQGKAVVLFGTAWDEPSKVSPPQPGDYIYPLYAAMQALIDNHVVIVTSTGNSGGFKLQNPNLPYNKVWAFKN